MISFPPYGEFARVYRESVDPTSLAPIAWRPGLSKLEREGTWLEWRNETVKLISKTLWPQWSEAQKAWINPDQAAMEALTVADFDLFAALGKSGVLDSQPISPVAAASIPTHRQYFVDEDSAKLGSDITFTTQPFPRLSLTRYFPIFEPP